jgi:hypothetical protein
VNPPQCTLLTSSSPSAAAACREALAAVARDLAWLAAPEGGDSDELQQRVMQGQEAVAMQQLASTMPSMSTQVMQVALELAAHMTQAARQGLAADSSQRDEQAAQTSTQCVLTIGGLIEGARWPEWLGGLVTKTGLWRFVAAAARDGQQLPRQYVALKRRQAQQGGSDGTAFAEEGPLHLARAAVEVVGIRAGDSLQNTEVCEECMCGFPDWRVSIAAVLDPSKNSQLKACLAPGECTQVAWLVGCCTEGGRNM